MKVRLRSLEGASDRMLDELSTWVFAVLTLVSGLLTVTAFLTLHFEVGTLNLVCFFAVIWYDLQVLKEIKARRKHRDHLRKKHWKGWTKES